MSSRTRTSIPGPLQPYLRLPPAHSQILLTSTLGSSATWLTSRFVGSVLSGNLDFGGGNADDCAVVLVSWLRDEKFWAGELRRGTGLDTSKLSSLGHFTFIDALAALATSTHQDRIQALITTTISNLSTSSGRKTVLILDAPDALLATASTTAQALNTLILHLRSHEHVHSTILTLSADLPFVAASTPSAAEIPMPLESETAAFLVQQAHASRFLMGVRELETGAARDVSGVLRVSRGGESYASEGEDGVGAEDQAEVKEMEALFLVQRDGGVKVFERGSEG